jgi:arylsulfatase
VAESAAAVLVVEVEEGTDYLLSGYTRYRFEGDPASLGGLDPFVPEAYVAWSGLAGPATAAGIELVYPVPETGEEMDAVPLGRSGDLLGVMMHWRVSRRVDEWNYFELAIEVPEGVTRLRLSLECRSLMGEVHFTDLQLTAQDDIARFLREGAYRYLPATEFTAPMKKMILLGDTFRASLAAYAPSRYVFDLVLPERPVLEFHTGLAGEPGRGGDRKVRFAVILEEAGSGRAEPIHRSALDPARAGSDWRRHSVDLSAHGGERVRIAFETAFEPPPLDERDRPSVVPLFGTPVLYERDPAGRKPSLLLLSIDCTREDHLGGHGHERDCTPFLDELAREGVDFLNAYSPSDLTYVVMPMLMTGRMIKFRWLGSFNVLDPAIPSLPEIMTREGYLCGGFCSDFYYNGFWKGFPFRPRVDAMSQREMDVHLIEKALDFIREHPDTPLFTWIHLNGPHPPCDGRPPGDRFVKAEGLEPALAGLRERAGVGSEASSWTAPNRVLYGGGPKDPETVQTAIRICEALYDGHLAETDARVRDFFGELDSLGVLENTLAAITSDHGIQLRFDGLTARGPREEGIRVPLILKGPGIPGEPRRIVERVSTIDFLPTVLELLEISAPEGLTGRSLAPLIQDGTGLPDRPVFALFTGSIAVWFDQYKYRIIDVRIDELLDPKADLDGPPMEGEFLHDLGPDGRGDDENIAAARRAVLTQARRILIDFWNALDASAARGPANQALVGFFRKAGYMK